MVITYRRTGGFFMLLVLAVAALTATVLTVAVAGVLLVVTAFVTAGALAARAVLPRRWRPRRVPAVAPSPQTTFDAVTRLEEGT
jgi:hypothetical protein